MATLVSPGVSVTVSNESFYATAGQGTIPLVIIATAENKFQPGSSTALASGTVKSNAGKLYRVTSQRDALQTFGVPKFYSVAGTPQYDNELNELGLFSLYEYLGIANTAYVLRADIDLGQLSPSTVEPSGSPQNGDYWFDLNSSTWGLFKSNGNPNGAYAWASKVPTVISDKAMLETVVQAKTATPIVNPTVGVITQSGLLTINNVNVSLAAGNSITDVANRINNTPALNKLGITATVFARTGKFYPDGTPAPDGRIYGDIYNLRLVGSNVDLEINLNSTPSSILTEIGLTTMPEGIDAPKSSIGVEGDFVVDAASIDPMDGMKKNRMWQKIALVTNGGTREWWFKVGSTDSTHPGWGWREASPRTITGSVPNPRFVASQQVQLAVAGHAPFPVVVPDTTLDGFVGALNTAFNSAMVNCVAKKSSQGNRSYLQIINFDGTDTWLHDDSDHTGSQHPFKDAGISTSQTFFGSVTGTAANPTFVGPVTNVSSALAAAQGTNYAVGDALTVQGGTGTSATLNVASVTAVNATIQDPGSNFQTNDTITFYGPNYTSPVILRVDSVLPGGLINAISIVEAGQYTGTVPANPISGTVTGTGLGGSFNITWGVGTVTVGAAGSYTEFPTNPVSVTGGAGSNATFNLTMGYVSSDVLSIDFGTGPVLINVPGTTLDELIAGINAAFPSYINAGLLVASKVTDSNGSYLKVSNPNGTNFTLQDVSGTPLNTAGIPVGYTFGRKLIYKGYSPTLTVPSEPSDLANENIWINTTPPDRGASPVVKEYINGTWTKMNKVPNMGTIPMYKDTVSADSGFMANKGIGTIFMMYNADGLTPAEADFTLMQWDGTAWLPLEYSASVVAPKGPPAAGTLWYNTDLMVDIMVSNGQVWQGYLNAFPGTDPNGPILDASAPLTQSDLTPLVDYDLWIDTSDIENYPMIYRYSQATKTWILIDNNDHSSGAGIIFADARANADGTKGGSTAPAVMATSDYVDPDSPDALLYPQGLLMFNTRYSTNNVKVWTPNALPTATYKDRWVTASGNKPDGTPYMGHWAQRNMVVEALKATVQSNLDARAEYTFFNLLACPGYTELLPDMVELNTDKKDIAFIIGDTPARLTPDGTSIQNWASNANNVAMDGPDGLITHSDYAGIYYPWALSTNLDGTSVFVPPSTMALRTYAYNDQVAYPWFAPAGFNRGLVTGVSSVGYLTADNTYQPVTLSQGQRDVMYINEINPIAYIPNRGLVIYGQKTLAAVASAMDRVNVSRLINYLNYQLDNLAKPFLFEPNDKQTRQAVVTTFTGFMGNLAGLRAIYDFAVVCDETNNTPTRIDRNELWIDIAIKPEKAIEFIYIPIRILNTGDPMPGAASGNATA